MDTKDLIAAFVGDGYLYGASDHWFADNPRYWLALRDEGAFTLVELAGVPQKIAEQLCAQGIPGEQYYSDGYEAARAAAPYVGRTLYSAD